MTPAEEESLYALYHENSKITPKTDLLIGQRIASFVADFDTQRKVDRSFKFYASKNAVPLCTDRELSQPLGTVLGSRRSVTPDSVDTLASRPPVSFAKLSSVLSAGYSENSRRTVTVAGMDFVRGVRTAPSGGGLFPLETYAWCRTVASGSPLVQRVPYHYLPRHQVLESTGEPLSIYPECFPQLGYEETPPSVILLITGLHKRIERKYGERAYRFLLLEAGHVMQNMLLAATSVGALAVPIGGFFDDKLATYLQLDPHAEYPLYPLFLW